MLDRILRAIRLDPRLYREVADDDRYTGEGILIVVIIALLAALGSAIGARRALFAFVAEFGSSLLLGWLLWSVVAYGVGTMLGGRSGVAEMARTLAYANAPRFLILLGFLPCVGWLFVLAAWLLSIAAGVIAIRESMEFDTLRAVVTAVLGLAVYMVASVFISVLLGGLGAPLAFLGR